MGQSGGNNLLNHRYPPTFGSEGPFGLENCVSYHDFDPVPIDVLALESDYLDILAHTGAETANSRNLYDPSDFKSVGISQEGNFAVIHFHLPGERQVKFTYKPYVNAEKIVITYLCPKEMAFNQSTLLKSTVVWSNADSNVAESFRLVWNSIVKYYSREISCAELHAA